jgi:hypothetical protein
MLQGTEVFPARVFTKRGNKRSIFEVKDPITDPVPTQPNLDLPKKIRIAYGSDRIKIQNTANRYAPYIVHILGSDKRSELQKLLQ